MAEGNVLFRNRFVVKNKLYRVSLTSDYICWEQEASTDLRTVLPWEEVISLSPCDCDISTKHVKCQYCRYNPDRCRTGLGEQVPLQARAVKLYYAERCGKYKWRLTAVTFRSQKGAVVRELLGAAKKVLQGLDRPHRLLIFINPYGGKKAALQIFERKVAPLLQLAGIDIEVIVTQYANHARNMIQEIDIEHFDGVVCVGGDGMFSELLNGLLVRTQKKAGVNYDVPSSSLVTPQICLGVIPAGSTDAVTYCTTGINDPVTSTLLIIMGAKLSIDICSIHHDEYLLQYATSFLSYGYFGDTLVDSEKHRWMGPKRYDYSGFKKFLQGQLYEGEIKLAITNVVDSVNDKDRCRAGCKVCTTVTRTSIDSGANGLKQDNGKDLKYLKIRGTFIAINVATMTCRCAMTKDGISPTAHLGNGCTDVILVTKCSRLNFLRYLFRTAFHNANPFDFDFVQFYRVSEFQFSPVEYSSQTISSEDQSIQENESKKSVWNCDGEILSEPAIQVKVHQQLINLYAYGIEERDQQMCCNIFCGSCKNI
ncbi:ceramide kinase-like isoform X1 [Tachypleus tridentatus]|uniref:ceramide kinase-like isoform X1 n=1 Tax=Tachypleus tridentatus TaxID=6853 RepID=UPI003FD5E781